MAVLSRADLLNQINTLLPDNNTEEISPSDLRSVLTDMLDSDYNLTDNLIQNIGGNLGTTNLSLTSNRTLNAGGVYSLTLGGVGQELTQLNANLKPNPVKNLNLDTSTAWNFFATQGTNVGFALVDSVLSQFQWYDTLTFNFNGFEGNNLNAQLRVGSYINPFEIYIRGSRTQGIVLKDSINNQSAQYDVDYFSGGFPTDRFIPDAGVVKSYLGGQTLSATAQSPTGAEDGYVLAWNNVFSEYELVAQSGGGGVNPGTDNRLPIYDAAGTNIEDSSFSVTLGTDGDGNNLFQRILGNDFNSGTLSTALTSVRLGHANLSMGNQFLDLQYAPLNGNGVAASRVAELRTNGVIYEQQENLWPGTGAALYDRHLFTSNGSNILEIFSETTGVQTVDNIVRVENNAVFAVRGEVNNRAILTADGTTQRVQVGVENIGNDLSPNGALFTIRYLDIAGWDANTPHMNIEGTIDSGLATLTNGDLWRETSDGKFYIREGGSSKPVVNDSSLPIIKKTGVSFNTTGVAGKSFINIIDADVNVNSVINITLDSFISDFSILHISAGAGLYTIYYDYVGAVVNVPYNVTII